MDPTTPLDAKAALRSRFRAYRERLGPADYAARSRRITDRAARHPLVSSASVVHVYYPLVARREIDTRPLIDELLAAGKTVVLPVVEAPSDVGAPRLRHVRYEAGAVLQRNAWGIEEPVAGASVPCEALDLVVVPALGAGRDGHRIGHGFGYYDAFLAGLSAATIGLVYAACLVDAVPAEAHDVPLHAVVTEAEVITPP